RTVPELFNLADRFQCPGIILSDLLISEGRSSVDPDDLSFDVRIDRGALIANNQVNASSGSNGTNGTSGTNGTNATNGTSGSNATNGHVGDPETDALSAYKRYEFTADGV